MEQDLILFDNLQQISEQAIELNLKQIIIAKSFQSKEEVKKYREKIGCLSNLEIKTCHLMQKPDNKELNRFVGATDFVCMLCDSLKNISFGVSNKKFDFILLYFDKNLQMNIDKETVMNAKLNHIELLLPISSILNATSFNKAIIMQKYAATIKICEKLGCRYSMVSGARRKEEMRNKRDLDETKILFNVK